jgi:ABC-type multidrug transport system fused ATPase/permease subunit
MDRGRIIDSGTHTELLMRCDVYARLAKNQMQSADDSMPEIISQQS